MKIFKFLTLFLVGIFFIDCSSNMTEKPLNTEETAIQEEVQQLDSLSKDLDSTIVELDKSTKALEESISELDDLD